MHMYAMHNSMLACLHANKCSLLLARSKAQTDVNVFKIVQL